jgi:hypothetical protein
VKKKKDEEKKKKAGRAQRKEEHEKRQKMQRYSKEEEEESSIDEDDEDDDDEQDYPYDWLDSKAEEGEQPGGHPSRSRDKRCRLNCYTTSWRTPTSGELWQ